MRVQEFDFSVHHIKGESNGWEDFISRSFDQQISHLYNRIKYKKNVPAECFSAKISDYVCNKCRLNLRWMEMHGRKSCSICQLTLKRREILFFCSCDENCMICSECAKESKQPLLKSVQKRNRENIALLAENDEIWYKSKLFLCQSLEKISFARNRMINGVRGLDGLSNVVNKRNKYSNLERQG